MYNGFNLNEKLQNKFVLFSVEVQQVGEAKQHNLCQGTQCKDASLASRWQSLSVLLTQEINQSPTILHAILPLEQLSGQLINSN